MRLCRRWGNHTNYKYGIIIVMPRKITNHRIAHQRKTRYKICISGAAETGHCSMDALQKAEQMGREIAKAGMTLLTGATTGTPYWAAKGAKAEGGLVIGYSPASSENAHIKTYRLPIDYHDDIIFTGLGYSGRNWFLTRAGDATIIICGRIGTLNEFTIAFEDNKPIGVLESTGGTADFVREVLERGERGPGRVMYSSNPKDLLVMVLKEIENNEKHI